MVRTILTASLILVATSATMAQTTQPSVETHGAQSRTRWENIVRIVQTNQGVGFVCVEATTRSMKTLAVDGWVIPTTHEQQKHKITTVVDVPMDGQCWAEVFRSFPFAPTYAHVILHIRSVDDIDIVD